jgi:hypothetical protein
MNETSDQVVEILKQQATLFLLDAGEFYPFGTCLNHSDNVVPVGVYFENDHPSSQEAIESLEKGLIQGVQNGNYKIAALAIDITIIENSTACDAIEIRFFEPDKEVYQKYFKYVVKDDTVEFNET